MPAKSGIIAISSIDLCGAAEHRAVRIARPAKGGTEPDRDLGGSEQHADGRADKSLPSQVPFHPQTAAKPPRFVLGRRFSAETRLINRRNLIRLSSARERRRKLQHPTICLLGCWW
jgi:hypothetical protein